jgi:hypothetical protein
MDTKWTPHLVAKAIEKAINTLANLPLERPRGYKSSWPEYIRDIENYRGKYDPNAVTLIHTPRANPEDIDHALLVLSWLKLVTRRDQLVLMDKAVGRSNDFMEAKYKKKRTTLYRWWSAALRQISSALNGKR